jgi:hypothetical protein
MFMKLKSLVLRWPANNSQSFPPFETARSASGKRQSVKA